MPNLDTASAWERYLDRCFAERQRITRQEWEGIVTIVRKDGFTARLIDLTHSNPDEEADFSSSEICPDDLDLIVPGAIFRWSVGALKMPGGANRPTSHVVFTRLPQWTKPDLDRADALAKELVRALARDKIAHDDQARAYPTLDHGMRVRRAPRPYQAEALADLGQQLLNLTADPCVANICQTVEAEPEDARIIAKPAVDAGEFLYGFLFIERFASQIVDPGDHDRELELGNRLLHFPQTGGNSGARACEIAS
jgi:hypothetical protein